MMIHPVRSACAAWVGALAMSMGVLAPASEGRAEPQVIADLTPAEVHGVFNTLHRTRDWVGQDLKIKGSRTRTRFHSTRQAPLMNSRAAARYDAYNSGWVIEVAHEGLFQLRDVSSTGLSTGGASVTLTQRAEGTRFIVESLYRFTWVPGMNVLLIEDIDGIGRATQFGTYAVAARSSTKVETEEGRFSFDLSGSGGFGFDFSKASAAARSFIDVRIRGNPYRIERGRVGTRRGLGLTRDFTFDLEWASEALMDFEATLVNNEQTVNSTLTYKFLATTTAGEGQAPLAEVNIAVETTSMAATTANSFLASIHYEANPALLSTGDGTRELGQVARHVISIDDFGSEFTSAQTATVRSHNQFDLQVTGAEQPIAIALGSRSLADRSRTMQRFSLPVTM